MNIGIIPLEDLEVVYAIEQQAHPYPWSKIALKDAFEYNLIIGIYQDKTLAGFAIVLDAVDTLELLNIAMLPIFQQRGYGHSLVKFVIQLAQKKNLPRVLLEVRRSNSIACSFYQKMGFKCIHQRCNYYRTKTGKEDALIMEYQI